jgi:hypothetical protein
MQVRYAAPTRWEKRFTILIRKELNTTFGLSTTRLIDQRQNLNWIKWTTFAYGLLLSAVGTVGGYISSTNASGNKGAKSLLKISRTM